MSDPTIQPHAFVRPGQVAPDLPPPDNCMTCGLPEAAHEPGIEARAAAARELLADYTRWTAGQSVAGDWQSWADKLAFALGHVLDGLAARGEPEE